MGRNTRKALLLVAVGSWLAFGAGGAEAGSIRDRDVATQREMATGRKAGAPSAATTPSAADPPGYNLLPGFVQPYGYPLPPYADGDNFETIHTDR